MNLKEKFIWNFAILISIIALIWNAWNLYNLNSNASKLYNKFISESKKTLIVGIVYLN